jgi:hypothetical protein|nr:MAG TPA: hypothetical protein [Caudoviricetes sp.]
MEKEILELINGSNTINLKNNDKKIKDFFREMKRENSQMVKANIRLIDKNKYLVEDIKILSNFISRYLEKQIIDEDVKRILNDYRE